LLINTIKAHHCTHPKTVPSSLHPQNLFPLRFIISSLSHSSHLPSGPHCDILIRIFTILLNVTKFSQVARKMNVTHIARNARPKIKYVWTNSFMIFLRYNVCCYVWTYILKSLKHGQLIQCCSDGSTNQSLVLLKNLKQLHVYYNLMRI
jgi:hypothetical protein